MHEALDVDILVSVNNFWPTSSNPTINSFPSLRQFSMSSTSIKQTVPSLNNRQFDFLLHIVHSRKKYETIKYNYGKEQACKDLQNLWRQPALRMTLPRSPQVSLQSQFKKLLKGFKVQVLCDNSPQFLKLPTAPAQQMSSLKPNVWQLTSLYLWKSQWWALQFYLLNPWHGSSNSFRLRLCNSASLIFRCLLIIQTDRKPLNFSSKPRNYKP